MEAKAARRRANDAFKKANPWYREGSTRGKQCVPLCLLLLTTGQGPRRELQQLNARADRSAAADRALVFERLLGLGAKPVKEEPVKEEEVGELDPRDLEFAEGGGGIDDDDIQFIKVEDPHLSVEERRKELDEDREDEPGDSSGGLRPEWKEFLAEAARSAERRDTNIGRRPGLSSGNSNSPTGRRLASFSTPDVIEISSDDELHADAPPKRLRLVKEEPGPSKPLARPNSRTAQASGSGSFKAQDLIREQRLRAFGMASTTLSGTSRVAGGPQLAKTTIKLEDGTDGWTCIVCSLDNPVSRTRCGESVQPCAICNCSHGQVSAMPVQMAPGRRSSEACRPLCRCVTITMTVHCGVVTRDSPGGFCN